MDANKDRNENTHGLGGCRGSVDACDAVLCWAAELWPELSVMQASVSSDARLLGSADRARNEEHSFVYQGTSSLQTTHIEVCRDPTFSKSSSLTSQFIDCPKKRPLMLPHPSV